MARTLLPWTTFDFDGAQILVRGTNPQHPDRHPLVASCTGPDRVENAEFIALACRSHGALVAALEKLADHLDARDAAHYHGSTPIVLEARAAIAAARGE